MMPSKILFLKAALICFLLISLGVEQINLPIFFCLTLVLLNLDLRNIFILKNYFLVYTFLLFCVAGHYFYPEDGSLFFDMFFYASGFILGYSVYVKKKYDTELPLSPQFTLQQFFRVDAILSFVLISRVFFYVWEVSKYGISNYYSGYALLFQFESYGKEDFVLGLLTIMRHIIDISSLSISVLYVYVCLATSRKIKYLRLLLLLVVLPFLSLRRSDFALGVMFLLTVSSLKTNFFTSTLKNYRRAVLGVLLILATGIVFGGIRYSLMRNDLHAEIVSSENILALISGEFTPIVAYKEIKSNILDLGYQHGGTIVPTLLFKLVPRSWMLDKPTSSSGYFMEKLFPAQAEAGYYISSSIFGDMYLNFGFFGALSFCILLGMYSARLDSTFMHGCVKGLPVFLIVFYHYYILLRGDLQGSLSLIVLTVVMYLLFKSIALGNRLHVRYLHKTIRTN